VLEADNQLGEPFFENCLIENISTRATEPLKSVLDGILANALAFSDEGNFDDKVCLLGIDIAWSRIEPS
jgi:phosphoserine phosphatase RsbU/P